MRLSPELLLAVAIFAFYLKDSLLLLHRDEAVMVRGLGGRWRAGFGARSWRLGGREPYLANPLCPHQPVFRLRWDMARPSAHHEAAPGGLEQQPAELMLLGCFAWITWLELFVLLPALLLSRANGAALATAAAVLYLNILLSLGAVWASRRPLGLTGRQCAVLAFECLVCAPYAANLVRRVAALRPSGEDFTVVAQRLVAADQIDALRAECLARIDEQIEVEPAEGAEALRLQAARSRFIVKDGDGQQ